MAPLTDLLSCSIIEKDSNGDVLWTWSYPTISESQKAVVARKCNLELEHNSPQVFVFSRQKHDWFYIHCSEVFDSDKLPKVKQFALVLFAKDFNPRKYEVLSRVLSKMYCKTGKPTEILQLYLSVFTKGSCSTQENGTFVSDDFNSHRFTVNTNIKELIKTFELETILIYTALLLKKRIIVYHHSLEQLLKWIGLFPALMKHRKVTDNLFPWIDLVDDELTELKRHSYYVAGCRNSSISSRTDLYDLLVNIPAREITVASHAKESLTMTKTHKEIALFMVQLCENQTYTETQIISEINDKTQDLLNQLTSLALVQGPDGRKMVSAQTLKEKNLPPAVENFLINLAVAENLFLL
ncbi:DENN domain-containing protein 10-like isoform X2 [Hylaeus anthracinus]|uniref:DENN domain-containing protein 10-like isoform X2 n=1 Tax=Hylaeus volcanicus TaxID=313075 RepID=UPI0023B82328|nr:DENN domain-containing protein 10-like isoform X2 [Hylaeus volcanicus]XP_054013423.1 DENN domain-containing protein 10-like isoform X2 [Hylaeus anthracinus]